MNNRTCSLRVNDISNKPVQGLQFQLDSPVTGQVLAGSLAIRGWVVHRSWKAIEIAIRASGSNTVVRAPVNIHRPGVGRRFPGHYNSDAAGFQLTLDIPAPGQYVVEAKFKEGRVTPLAIIEIGEYESPKLVFMHIAKAAGSTVNSYFASQYPKSRYATHIESDNRWRKDPDYLQKFDFFSGHVGIFSLGRRFDLSRYYLVTVVREPFVQLSSHLAWIRKLSDPGEEHRLDRHPEYIRVFSDKLAKLDLSSPRDLKMLVQSLTEEQRQLVDNCQVRYFTRVELGQRVSSKNVRSAVKATGLFNRIGTADDLDQFLNDVADDMGWSVPPVIKKENVTRNFYGLENAGIRVRSALKPLVRYDIQLYDYIRRKRSG